MFTYSEKKTSWRVYLSIDQFTLFVFLRSGFTEYRNAVKTKRVYVTGKFDMSTTDFLMI